MASSRTASIVITMLLSFSVSLAVMLWHRSKDSPPSGGMPSATRGLAQIALPAAPVAHSPPVAETISPSPAAMQSAMSQQGVAPPGMSSPGMVSPEAVPPGAAPFSTALVSQVETDSSGSFAGLRVTQVQDLKTFIRSGLMIGDVIAAVNGARLDADNGQEMLNTLTHGTTVTVIRHNKAIDVTLDLTP